MENEVAKIDLMSLVNATGTNSEGIILYNAMEKEIRNGKIVELSLLNSTPFSSSFLNSSFGALWEKFGDSTLKGRVKIINFQPTRRDQIFEYISNLREVTANKT